MNMKTNKPTKSTNIFSKKILNDDIINNKTCNNIIFKNNLITSKKRFEFSINSFPILFILIITLSIAYIIPTAYSQDEFEIQNMQDNYHNNDFIDERIEMPNHRMGAHPAFHNMEHQDMRGGAMHNRRFNNHPGINRDHNMIAGGGHAGRNFHSNGIRINNYQNNNQQIISNNNNMNSFGPFGIFNSSLANSIYEILMMIFLLGFLYNCFCGKNANDKHALAWYNSNKQYFEERYSELGIKNGDEDDDNTSILYKNINIILYLHLNFSKKKLF